MQLKEAHAMTEPIPRKLYRVTIEVDYIAYAESEKEAIEFAGDALDDVFVSDHADALEMRATSSFPSGWNDNCLVYQERDQPDTTLGEARKQVFGVNP